MHRRYTAGMKRYDRDYFDHWYRDSAAGRSGAQRLGRKVALAVATAEHHLERPIRNVLDLGCGEGAWRAPLRALRPDVDYLGFDSSEYAVRRFGARRNLHLARFGDFRWLRPGEPVDLLVCADVLHYVPARELREGLSGVTELCRGVAWLELFCRGDAFLGDTDGFIARPPAWYRRVFADAGLTACGNHAWLVPDLAGRAAALELAGA